MVTDPEAPPWLGAAHPTNNTAELTGLGEALRYVVGLAVTPPAVTIASDSEYAIHAMLGIDAPRRNRRLVARVQSLWAQARDAMARGGGLN